MFSRYTPNAKLLPCPEFLGKEGGNQQEDSEHLTIMASNRFFTPAKQSTGLEVVDINAEIDPRGILSKVDHTKFLHTEDNTVEYYIIANEENGTRQALICIDDLKPNAPQVHSHYSNHIPDRRHS
ncbi:hypothetical protein PTI98_005712 [Pleurotus ostreatus]|nr:hypothetical protein PTI98_005712 [Pleurotus ostreatus]